MRRPYFSGRSSPTLGMMLATLGDLVEDIVVRHDAPINEASDTAAQITRRRGGRSRFLGQVGADTIGRALVDELNREGVDISAVRRSGTTGTIVALVDQAGERSMLTDRRACLELDRPDPGWLDGITVLHVPLYSLVEGSIADSASKVIEWAHAREIAVSIDASSTAIVETFGIDRARDLIRRLNPAVLLANGAEAQLLRIDAAFGKSVTVVKNGADPAVLHVPGSPPVKVPAVTVASVPDTTGAGDAFAAGLLCHDNGHGWEHDPIAACNAGHAAAAALLSTRSILRLA